MVVSRQFDYLKTSKNDLHCQRTSQLIGKIGRNRGWSFKSLINGSDEVHL